MIIYLFIYFNYKDSSVIVFDNTRQHRTQRAIKLIIKDFSVGYGDKEMYWLAATAANEPFAFEPYFAGSLGDCGALLHFDPTAETSLNLTVAEAFYTNAEYLVDLKKLTMVGDFLNLDGPELQVTIPVLVNEKSSAVNHLTAWKKMAHGFYPCGACEKATCVPASNMVVEEVQYG